MSSPRSNAASSIARIVPWALAVVLAGGAVIAGLRGGVPGVVLWFGFVALVVAAVQFWNMLEVLGPSMDALESDTSAARLVLGPFEQRKQRALRALGELEFERRIGRMSDEDLAPLRERYRAEAVAAMEAMEAAVQSHREAAEALLNKSAAQASGSPATVGAEAPGELPAANVRLCMGCSARNDTDAVFCKKCGGRLG